MRTSSEIPFIEQFGQHPSWKVGKLCELLGWSSPAQGRPPSVLSEAILQYRRRKFCGDQDLPLILPSNHPTVELCAKYFCRSDRRQKFFPKSPESVANNWPSWSEDSELIIENLAKLIWVQEYNQRRNADSSERREREQKAVGYETPKKPSKPVKKDTPKKQLENEENEEDDIEDDKDYTPKKSVPKPKPVSTPHIKRENVKIQDVLEQRNISDKEANLQFNIEENLNWAYPLDLEIQQEYPPINVSHQEFVVEPQDISWVFQERGSWPDEVKAVAWRYMHEHQLYSYKPRPDAVGGMAKMLREYLGITCNDSQFALIFDKSKKFIHQWTRKWYRDFGLLDGDGEMNFKRTDKFDSAWRPRREIWFTSPERTPLDGLNEDEPIGKVVAKRSNESTTDSSSKRQKIPNSNDIPVIFPETALKNNVISETPNISTTPENDKHLAKPFGKTDVFDQDKSTSKPVSAIGCSEQPAKLTSTAAITMKETSMTNLFPNINTNYPLRQPNGSTDFKPIGIGSAEARTESTTTPNSFEPSPPTEQFFKTSYSQSPGPGFPVQNHKVNFILPDSNNRLDFKNPVSGIRRLSASDFFGLYAKRTGIPLPQLISLTFVVVFANRDEIEVTKCGGEDSWRSCKKRVTHFFSYTRKHNPGETDFEVWVMNTSKTDAALEVEDDEFAGL